MNTTKKKKRNLFSELREGIEELQAAREGRITLRTVQVKLLPPPELSAAEIIRIRESMRMSQAVFAAALRVEKRSLERWEQGRSKPGPAASTLILLAARYPDTLTRVATL
jgi:putative transcriptional regulator